MSAKIWIGAAIALLSLGVGKLYLEDAATVEQAIVVEEYVQDYCRLHNGYPEYETLERDFPELYPNRDWHYWPDATLTSGTIQYPMTLPVPGAPGTSKLSEFLPIIYAYAIRHPCEGLIPETDPLTRRLPRRE